MEEMVQNQTINMPASQEPLSNGSTQTQPTQTPPPTQKNDTKLLIVLFIVILVLIAATLGLFVLAKNAQETSNISPTRIPNPTISEAKIEDENDPERIDLGNPEEDLQSIEQDLKAL